MYYIYAYIDPRNNLPFYIGKGKGNRKFDHLKEDDSNTENRNKLNIISDLKAIGMAPTIVELETDIDNELLAYNREDFYILKYGRKGIDLNGILANKTIGGKSPPKPVWTEEKKKSHSEFNKEYWTPERRKAHGLRTKGNSGGQAVKNTVSVIDIDGNTKRIAKSEYDAMPRTGDINTWEYVSVSSNEAKKRKQTKHP